MSDTDHSELMSSDSDVEELLLLYALTRPQQTEEKPQSQIKISKRVWVHDNNKKRKELGEYHRLCEELSSHEDRFFKYFCMSQALFEELHEMLLPKISKCTTNWRTPISARERLVIFLRYIATGDSYQTIASSFRVGRSTVSHIVSEVCKEIWNTLQPEYILSPTKETWEKSEIGYRETWNFPNCIGNIDGKYVTVNCPRNREPDKKKDAVLLTIIDPYYKFIVVDVGSYGCPSDSCILENTIFYREFIHGKSLLPDKPLPGTDDPVPHIFIGDETFVLKKYLMRPFSKALAIQDERKANFNKRLCNARRVVENTFGILAQKWRIFLRPIECDVDTAIGVIKAACCLHNYLRIKQGMADSPESEKQKARIRALTTLRSTNKRSKTAALEIREKYVSYFNQ